MSDEQSLHHAICALDRPVWLRQTADGVALADPGDIDAADGDGRTAWAPSVRLEDLGDPSFCADHGLRYPYVAGAMANGIASAELVEAMARAGMLAFFGSAGLSLPVVEAAVRRLARTAGDLPYGFNLIHSPNEPALENAVVDLYLRHGVRLVEASAYLDLTPALVRYRLHGIRRDDDGSVVVPNRVIAKVSRVEVATKFFSPAPERIVQDLVRQGHLTAEQARLAEEVPVAQDVTAEADSGGHTDNRPLVTLLPTLLALRDRLQDRFGYPEPPRVGGAGGIATPASAAAAFAMGAAYVLTGTINQACVESGSSDAARALLAQAEQADVAMAPAADMFEMGVKVQVLKRGTMFAMRAAKLYELYRAHPGLEALPMAEQGSLEKNLFRGPVEEVWAQTRAYFLERDPSQLARAERDPRHRMALVFRWYLGQSSRWANAGEPTRQVDYQVWCGPAMGAFNEWARGSFLEDPHRRRVVAVALNLLYGASVLGRVQVLRSQGVALPAACGRWRPLEPEQIEERLHPLRAPA